MMACCCPKATRQGENDGRGGGKKEKEIHRKKGHQFLGNENKRESKEVEEKKTAVERERGDK